MFVSHNSRKSALVLAMALTVFVSTAGLANAQSAENQEFDFVIVTQAEEPIEILDAVLLVPFFVVEETEIRGDTFFDIVVEDNRGRYVPWTIVVTKIGDGMYLVTVPEGMDDGISTDEDSAGSGIDFQYEIDVTKIGDGMYLVEVSGDDNGHQAFDLFTEGEAQISVQ